MINFWHIDSIPLVYMSSRMPVSNYLDHYNTEVCSEIRIKESSNSLIFWNCLGNLRSLEILCAIRPFCRDQQSCIWKVKRPTVTNTLANRKDNVEDSNVWDPLYYYYYLRFQFSSVAQSYPALCDPMNLSTPGLPVHHQLSEFTQTHVHRVGNAIQPFHPL